MKTLPTFALLIFVVGFIQGKKNVKNFGDAGDRTRGLSHAKRTRYHCATSPVVTTRAKNLKVPRFQNIHFEHLFSTMFQNYSKNFKYYDFI